MADANDSHDNRRAVWLHVHVPKAGGSTLRHLMNRTFDDAYYNSTSLLETKQYTRFDVSEIVRCHPQFAGISDHKYSLDLPYDHEHANVFALSYVRDPVERFISRYFFHRHFEEVNCIAQRMNFRDFANAELADKHADPQTNSQIYFLNGGTSHFDTSIIESALATGRAFLHPIERFDESCIALERLFPETFPDLSYVRANVSKKDAKVSDEDRQFVRQFLQDDFAVCELADAKLDRDLATAFPGDNDRNAAMTDFQDRCSRRIDNFQPLRPKGSPAQSSQAMQSTGGDGMIGWISRLLPKRGTQ